MIWGTTFVISDTALGSMSPAALTVARFVLALLVLAPVAIRRGGIAVAIRSPSVAVLGATGVGAYYGLQTSVWSPPELALRPSCRRDSPAAGKPEQAQALLRELENYTGIPKTQWAALVHQAVRWAVVIQDIELARGLVNRLEATGSPIPVNQHSLLTARAVLAHADRDYNTAVDLFTEAAERWDRFGSRVEHAHALLGLAENGLAAGHAAANDDLRQALELFTSMGADYRVHQCQQLLEGGTASGPRTA